jgi:hypothetical protein
MGGVGTGVSGTGVGDGQLSSAWHLLVALFGHQKQPSHAIEPSDVQTTPTSLYAAQQLGGGVGWGVGGGVGGSVVGGLQAQLLSPGFEGHSYSPVHTPQQ